MVKHRLKTVVGILCSLFCFSTQTYAAEPAPSAESLGDVFSKKSFSPYADRNFPSQVYWGDTHLHTSLSMDAGAFGNRLSPDDAYRFAKGEQVTATSGYQARLSRPLDWLVVADHSDGLGMFTMLYEGDPGFLKLGDINKELSQKIQKGGKDGVNAALYIIDNFSAGKLDDSLVVRPDSMNYKRIWQQIVDTAELHNDPGKFTAFIGYEWTSLIKGNNLHRVVIYRDGSDYARPIPPFTTIPPEGSPNPRDLWKWMENYEKRTGGDVLAIAHNGNLSNGIMFPERAQYNGKRLDKTYVQQRQQREPLYEATQIKGDGETHPFLSPNDEFADYENWDKGNLNMSEAKKDSMLAGEYAREGLKRGLLLEKKFGTNPYKFGMIGSTDSHTSLATAQEDNFFGKHSGIEPSPERPEHIVAKFGDQKVLGWEQVASGLAAVWAKDNTRESIFDAMERREVYATTGSRISVRFFGGWEFNHEDTNTRLPAKVGYQKGVPMGSDLTKAPEGKAPSFLVAARKDPLSGNLDRIQIIKGWLDSKGKLHEKIYDVAVSDGRKINAEGRSTTPVGNTVDVANATWTNSIGDPEMITVWSDPDFRANETAFYYARVIEIPTPRWTTYEAVRFGITLPKEVPLTTQERAYTSPIWYTP